MTKSPDAFRTISEVAAWLGVQAHVLRFWESKFPQVKPIKRAGGRRYYRPADMRLIGGIKTLLHDDGMTIKGVQKLLREQGLSYVSDMSPPLDADEVEIPLIEAEEERGTVLAFKAKPSTPILVQLPIEPASDEAASAPESEEIAEADSPEEMPATESPAENLAAPPAEAAPGLPLFDQPAPPAAEERPAPAETEEEPPLQPAFLAQAPSALATPAVEPVAAPATAGSEAAEGDLSHAPGLLGQLAGIAALSRIEAARIAPFARALRDWYDRQEKTIGR